MQLGQVESLDINLDSKKIFEGPEFVNWTEEKDLYSTERLLVERFLDPQGKTLEAGCGGGRILRALSRMGFDDLRDSTTFRASSNMP